MDFDKLMTKARKTNKSRDRIDRRAGFATPDANPMMLLRTAMSAIECGIKTDDWNAVAEGQAMLEQLEPSLTK